MKKILCIIAVLFLIISGCKSKDESTGGTRTDGDNGSSFSLESFTVPIAGLDNLVISNVAQVDQNMSNIKALFAAQVDGNIFSNKDGEMITVEIPPGHLVKKVHDVKGGNNPGLAITFYVDATDDTTVIATCVLDASGDCNLELYEPRKMSGLGNAPFFHENNGKRRYLTNDSMVTVDMITGEEMSIPFPPNGQVSINDNGHMIIYDGAETTLSALNDTIIPDVITDSTFGHGDSLFLNETKFYVPHKNGFLVKGKIFNDFYRLVDSSGDLEVRMAQEIAYNQYINGVNGVYNRIWTQSSLSNCTSHIVGDDDIMICGSKVYDLGDALNDISQKNINYSGHSIFDLTIKAGNSLYIYSKSELNNWYKLTVEDVINESSELITDGYRVVPECFDIINGATDTLHIGSVRLSDGEDIILKINNADSTPDIIETIGECDQIVSF